MKTRLLRPSFFLIGLVLAAGPALAETRMEKTLKLEPGGQFTLDTELGKVTVRGTSASGGIDVRDLVGDLEAETSGGSIHLRDIKGKSRVETSGGGIEADNLDGPLKAETSGGSVNLDRVRGDIHAHSSGGGIHIREAGGRVDADTSGGSIEAAFSRGNSRGGNLESSGGGITVSLDPAVGLAIDAHGNSVSSDLPLTV